MTVTIDLAIIDGKRYFTVQQFSSIVHKSNKTIYSLIHNGNAVRKLKCVYFMDKPMIPENELTEFPFTGPGRYPLRDIYHYTSEGIAVPCEICSNGDMHEHS